MEGLQAVACVGLWREFPPFDASMIGGCDTWLFPPYHFFLYLSTAPELERQSVHRSGEYRPADVVVRPGVLATAAHAARGQSVSTRLVSSENTDRKQRLDPGAGSAQRFWIFRAVDSTGQKHQTCWKRSLERLPSSRQNALSGDQKGEKPA